MKLNLKIKQIVEDLNFEIDKDQEVQLNKDSKNSIIDKSAQDIMLHNYESMLKDLKDIDNVKSSDKKEWLKVTDFYSMSGVKYIADNNSLSEIITSLAYNYIYMDNLNWIDTSNVTDMANLFQDRNEILGDISEWIVDNVTDMNSMFVNCSSFNQDITKWNTSKVEDMADMFEGCTKFDLNISNWDTSNVKSMSYMFCGAKYFNQPIGKWNVNNVEDMEYMFSDAQLFKQDLINWNVKKVKKFDKIFNNTLMTYEFIPKFNVLL